MTSARLARLAAQASASCSEAAIILRSQPRILSQTSQLPNFASRLSVSAFNSRLSTNASRSHSRTLPRAFSTSAPTRDFHFDTHHFVQRLEREGLNRAQAEGIMSAMAEVIDESIRNITSNMVTKGDQEKVRPPSLTSYRPSED